MGLYGWENWQNNWQMVWTNCNLSLNGINAVSEDPEWKMSQMRDIVDGSNQVTLSTVHVVGRVWAVGYTKISPRVLRACAVEDT